MHQARVKVGRTRRACEHAHSGLAAIRPTSMIASFCKAITLYKRLALIHNRVDSVVFGSRAKI